MSYASLPLDIPDPFGSYPSQIAVPLTNPTHISAGQTLTNQSAVQLAGSQLLAPLILNFTGAFGSTGAFTFPTAQQLQNAYGGVNQVQPGDVYIVNTVALSTNNVPVLFSTTTGGTGSKAIPAYGSTGPVGGNNLIIRFLTTGTPISIVQPTFTLQ